MKKSSAGKPVKVNEILVCRYSFQGFIGGLLND